MVPYLIITAVCRLWLVACAQEVLFSRTLRYDCRLRDRTSGMARPVDLVLERAADRTFRSTVCPCSWLVAP